MKQILFICLLFGAFLCFAQAPMPEIISIDESYGLYLSDEIADVKVDKDGFVWIVSFSEIVRYDGTNFTEIVTDHIDHGSFLKFNETKEGQRFVGDLKGAVFFIENDSIRPCKYNNILTKINCTGKKALEVRFVNGEEDIQAFPVGMGMHFIKNGNHTFQNSSIHSINFVLNEGELPMVISEGVNSNRKRRDSSTKVVVKNNLFKALDSTFEFGRPNSYFRSVVQLMDGSYIGVMHFKSLYLFSSKGALKKIPFAFDVLNLFADSKGNLWVSTKDNGVYLYKQANLNSNETQIYFPNQSVILSSEDKDGNLWGYSENGGVLKIERPDVLYFNQQTGFPEIGRKSISVIEKVGDSILYSLNSNRIGVLDLNKGKTSILEIPELDFSVVHGRVDPQTPVGDLKYDESRKRLWIAQSFAIRYLEGGKIYELKQDKFNLPNYSSNNFYSASTSNNSVFSIAGTHFMEFYKCFNNELTYVSKIFPEPLYDVIFFNDSALLDSKSGTYLYKNDSIIELWQRHPQLNKKVYDWTIWDGNIWISHRYSGIKVLIKDSVESFVLNESPLKHGQFLTENDSSLWIFTNQGSFNIGKKGTERIIKKCKPLPNHIYTDFVLDNKNVYASTKRSGIVKFNLDILAQETLLVPKIFMERVVVDGILQKSFQKRFNLEHTQNDFSIYFNVVSFNSGYVNYRYKSIGQSDWISTTENKIEFRNLAPNTYQVEIQARIDEQSWSDSEILYFIISPPFWKKWWFITLWTLSVVGLIIFVIRRRITRLNREKMLTINRLKSEQKALRAKMDPHFMFNVLSSLQYLVTNNLNEKASVFLEQFSSLMRTTLDQTSSEIVSVREELNFLAEYMEMERLRLEEKFNYQIELHENCEDNVSIPNFLIQPFIENAIHHGIKLKEGVGKISLNVKRHGDYIRVVIEDDGIGLNTTLNAKLNSPSKRNSYGIETVRKRLKLKNGKDSVALKDLSTIDTIRSGTRVELLILIERV